MKLCMNCKYWNQTSNAATDTCEHPSNVVTDVVRGGKTYKAPYCSTARVVSTSCGQDAKWFEARE